MQHFSLKSEQSLYVGDMVIDAIAGRRAKIRTVIVTTGSNTKQEVKKGKPYIVINRIFDLLQVL
jgi:phosphoglycolate phosphatase-like HAD superfamily hydrolase